MGALAKFLTAFLLAMLTYNAQAFWFSLPSEKSIIDYFGPSSLVAPESCNFDVLVWNTFKGKKKTFQQDFKTLTHNKQLVVLQEAFQTRSYIDAVESTSLFYAMGTSFIYDKNDIATGVMTGAAFEPIDHTPMVSPYKEIIGNTPKVVLLSKYILPTTGKELLVANIHAINSVTSKMFAKQIDQVTAHLAQHDGPAIFAGDFNTWSKSKLLHLKSRMLQLGMREIVFKNSNQRMKVLGNYLDWIFVKELSDSNATVHGNIEGSDHKPMTVTLSNCRT